MYTNILVCRRGVAYVQDNRYTVIRLIVLCLEHWITGLPQLRSGLLLTSGDGISHRRTPVRWQLQRAGLLILSRNKASQVAELQRSRIAAYSIGVALGE
ncbi:hypothetical protein FKM82_004599 [Ascaphus truei]